MLLLLEGEWHQDISELRKILDWLMGKRIIILVSDG